MESKVNNLETKVATMETQIAGILSIMSSELSFSCTYSNTYINT